jgi:hypothetical protein
MGLLSKLPWRKSDHPQEINTAILKSDRIFQQMIKFAFAGS